MFAKLKVEFFGKLLLGKQAPCVGEGKVYDDLSLFS